MSKIIGIDLGTTNSVVAFLDEAGDPQVIVNEEGDRLTPSVVAFDDKGQVTVGALARRQAAVNVGRTVYSIKRFMGRRFGEVGPEELRMPYAPKKGGDGGVVVELSGRKYSPQELSAKVLMKLKRSAEAYLGQVVSEAVITVPAYFNDAQREATREAGKSAGLAVKRIVNEPTAAALAYGLDKKKDELIAVYDFGGGTFDISILQVGSGTVEVISTNGDTHLGGDDIDALLMDWLVAQFKGESGLDTSADKTVLQRFKEAAEQAKIELSSVEEAEINLPFLVSGPDGLVNFVRKFTRAQLQEMIGKLVERTLEACKRALKDADKKSGDMDEVVMVGGSTRIPLVLAAVEKFFGRKPHTDVNPDEVVALGAAIQGSVMSGTTTDVLLLDVTPLTLGVETVGGVATPIIARNSRVPAERAETFSTGMDDQTSVEIHIVQGERPMARDNRTLGCFLIAGIEEAPRGVPQIEIKFVLDASGILSVVASDKVTGRLYISTRLAAGSESEADVHRMVMESETREAANRARRREVKAHLAAQAQPA